jgi:hypothetical protein
MRRARTPPGERPPVTPNETGIPKPRELIAGRRTLNDTMRRVLALAGIALVAGTVLLGCRGPGAQSPDQAPAQPIAFYHDVHAGQNQIPCMYCHFNAERSAVAGVPSVQLCVGCHVPGSAIIPPEQAQLAFPAPERDSLWHAEAQKLVGYWQRQEAIPWVRVHQLPAHANFPHMSHVRVGIECQTCHGPVEEMQEVYQFSSLQMGWCIDCHRGQQPLSENELRTVQERSTFVRRIASLASAGVDVQGVESTYPNQIASTDCFVCHY